MHDSRSRKIAAGSRHRRAQEKHGAPGRWLPPLFQGTRPLLAALMRERRSASFASSPSSCPERSRRRCYLLGYSSSCASCCSSVLRSRVKSLLSLSLTACSTLPAVRC